MSKTGKTLQFGPDYVIFHKENQKVIVTDLKYHCQGAFFICKWVCELQKENQILFALFLPLKVSRNEGEIN